MQREPQTLPRQLPNRRDVVLLPCLQWEVGGAATKRVCALFAKQRLRMSCDVVGSITLPYSVFSHPCNPDPVNVYYVEFVTLFLLLM